ncbi:MAG: hypothetical protein J5695_05040 [Bacteroidales bacterium]|nr:hypothetical protein [Bacteroidales bacterium]
MSSNNPPRFLSMEDFNRIKSQYSKFNEPWQSSEIEELKNMKADDVPIQAIAQQLQRTPGSIRMKLKSLGLYTPRPAAVPWTEEDENRLVAMYSDGIPFEEMAETIGRSVTAIISRLVRLRMNLFN